LRSGRESAAIRPNEQAGYWAISSALSALGRFDEAITATQLALALNPKSLPDIEGLAWIYTKMKRYPDVIRELRRALEIKPDDVRLRAWLAETHSESGDLAAASREKKAISETDRALADEVAALIEKSRQSKAEN